MFLDFTQKGLSAEKMLKWRPALELQISGENQDDHHGAEHTSTSRFFHFDMMNIGIMKMNTEISLN